MRMRKPPREGNSWKRMGWGSRLGTVVLLAALILAWSPAYGEMDKKQKDSLLDTLYKKNYLTEEEYQNLKNDEGKMDKLLSVLGGLSIGTLSYVEYSAGEIQKDGFNRFALTRGYINIKKKLTPWLGFRVTPDVHQDSNGDFNVRLKYLYAEFRVPDIGFFTDTVSEVGIGHMPWLDFEEHLNPYRCQGTMFLERAGIFNSSDLGVSIRGYLGGQVANDFQTRASKDYPGRYGSWHVGVYNGAGYHGMEINENKIPEVRVTLRPLPDLIPGLQVSYFGLFGKGNAKIGSVSPEYNVNLAMLSYQSEWVIFTGQYARTRGNNSGSLVVPNSSRALRGEGFSFFLNTRLPFLDRKLNLFGRFDRFDPDTKDWVTTGDDCYQLAIGGLAWEFYHHWLLLLDYEQIMYDRNNGGVGKVPSLNNGLDDDWKVQTVLQIEF